MLYRTPFFLTVSTTGAYQSVPALIAAAKANPGTVSYGSSYVGSPSHLGSAEFEFLTGTKMIHVPYKDQSQMYVAIAGECPLPSSHRRSPRRWRTAQVMPAS